jgi:hypothetical protein
MPDHVRACLGDDRLQVPERRFLHAECLAEVGHGSPSLRDILGSGLVVERKFVCLMHR